MSSRVAGQSDATQPAGPITPIGGAHVLGLDHLGFEPSDAISMINVARRGPCCLLQRQPHLMIPCRQGSALDAVVLTNSSARNIGGALSLRAARSRHPFVRPFEPFVHVTGNSNERI